MYLQLLTQIYSGARYLRHCRQRRCLILHLSNETSQQSNRGNCRRSRRIELIRTIHHQLGTLSLL